MALVTHQKITSFDMPTQSQPLIVFSHGQDGEPWGSKTMPMAEVARALGYQAESIDYRGMADPHARVDKLLTYCLKENRQPVLVGSSMGGHVATAVSQQVNARGLFLLAPAFFMAGFELYTPTPANCPVDIVHGWHDDIVPVDNSIRWARMYNATLHLVDDGHRLTDSINRICELLNLFLIRLTQRD
jgi:surfactin synthase thioesterase subunit